MKVRKYKNGWEYRMERCRIAVIDAPEFDGVVAIEITSKSGGPFVAKKHLRGDWNVGHMNLKRDTAKTLFEALATYLYGDGEQPEVIE